MKKHIFLLITALLLVHVGYGQGQKDNNAPIDNKDFLIIDNGNEKPIFANYLIDSPHDDIASDRWLKPEEVLKYGVKNNHYRLVLLKPGLEVITLKDIFEMYRISQEDQQLNLYIDGFPEGYIKHLAAIKSEIVSVYTMTSPTNKQKVLNIVTKHPAKEESIH